MRLGNRRWILVLALFQAAERSTWAADATATVTRLQIEIAFRGISISSRRETAAIGEARAVWARYGVDVRAWSAGKEVSPDAVTIPVRLIDRQAQAGASEMLGSITFVNAAPEPAIEMFPNAIAALVSTVEFFGRTVRGWPTGFSETIFGRVLGRALAHEIGHFLLRTTRHSPAGLMRAQQPARELVDPDRRGFVLSADEVNRLASKTLQTN